GHHPRVGTQFPNWHAVAPPASPGPQMLLASVSPDPAVVANMRCPWLTAALDRDSLFGADHVVVRPDGYVAAVCDDAELPTALAALTQRLHART
ncbi:MAG: hypothetical protein KGR47_03875, partial [Acidobacteria bacterium]|nr:hypothetical protein [Acidobacteriota bacterium]